METRFYWTTPDQVILDRIACMYAALPPCQDFDFEDLKDRLVKGLIMLGVVMEHGDVKMFAFCEVLHYPKFQALNIMALSGKNLQMVAAHSQRLLERACNVLGIKVIEARCMPAQARLFSRYGLSPVYQVLRKEL